MQPKFEYQKVPHEKLMTGPAIDVKKLNDLGTQGWELVLFSYVCGKLAYGYFKREVKPKL